MKIRLKNIGVVSEIDIDFSKPFILFAGSNGSGKTYVTSFIYTFLLIIEAKMFRQLNERNNEYLINRLLINGDNDINSNDIYDMFNDMMNDTMDDIITTLHLSINKRTFSCQILTTRNEWENEFYMASCSLAFANNILKKQKKSTIIKQEIDQSILSFERICFAKTTFLMYLFFDGVFGAQMFTAERNGIYTFSKELTYNRLKVPEANHMFSYPLPIENSLIESNSLNAYKKNAISRYMKFADAIEKQILHGSLNVDDKGEISFVYNKKIFGINQISSTAKTLAPLVFHLRYMTGTKNLLLIDEPELNLHPSNQILLARILGEMINNGLRLIISTHSDYIIREINNMIMAKELTKNNDELCIVSGYDKAMCLDKDKFAAYYFNLIQEKKVKVENLSVDEFGFSMPSIDEAIEKQNQITNDFYETLKYKYNI